MKKWKCSVCGYIHTGDEPPEKCPVCGADRSLFVALAEEMEKKTPTKAPTVNKPKPANKKWKCSVCGYINSGDEPPEKCPVCGADRSLFVALEAEVNAENRKPSKQPADPSPAPKKASAAPETGYAKIYDRLTFLMSRNHAHPITVHIPNGVLPVSMIFIALSILFGSGSLATAAFSNLVIVALSMPVVLFTGYTDWQRIYGGHLTKIFKIKIFCGLVVLLVSAILSIWWALVPELLESGTPGKPFFIFLCIVMLGAAVVAGLNGGKLVFPNKK